MYNQTTKKKSIVAAVPLEQTKLALFAHWRFLYIERKQKQTIMGFWVNHAYARSRRCVRMHKPTYTSLPKNTVGNTNQNLI